MTTIENIVAIMPLFIYLVSKRI